jgi:putative ABC transport system permease protein
VTDKLLQDLRYALRLWRRRPAFALVAVLTLALGIGANTAMFSVVNAVLLRPLPYARADRLVMLWGRGEHNPRTLIAYAEYDEIRRQSHSIDDVALWLGQSVNLTDVAEPQRIIGAFVSGSFFDVLGLKSERGRLFQEAETTPGHVEPVVVISHEFWERKFSRDPAAVGATLTLNGTPLTVIGVLAPPFDLKSVPNGGFFLGYDVFIPAAQFPAPRGLAGAGPSMLMVGRLKEGATLSGARADLDVIFKRLQAAYPDTEAGRSATIMSAQESIVGDSRTPLFLLLASVGAVLLIACVNVSNLLLARAVDRQREIALRAALGASRTAVTRQMAVEAGLLAFAAAVIGLLVGRWSLQVLAWLQPASVPIPEHIALDWTVLLFTGGVAIAVALLCGLAPALRSAVPDLRVALQGGFRHGSSTGSRTRDALVVIEVALSVALVAIAGLIVQSLLAVQRVPVGFDPSHVLTLEFRLPQAKYPKPADIARFFQQAIERVRAVPGVESAALVRAVPFSGNWGDTAYTVDGQTPAGGSAPRARSHIVSPEYFKTLRIPIVQGRDFTDRDDLQAQKVALVNETFARSVWPNEDPVGKRVNTQDFGWVTVIGVAGDTKHLTATEPAQPQLYLSHFQMPLIFSSLVARTAGPPMSVSNDVRKAVWAVDKDQPMWAMRSLDDLIAASQGQTKFLAMLLGVFAGLALLLAGVGVYGVMSYSVAQRTHEIGIRLALGASGGRVLREVIGRAGRLTAAAVVAGLVLAIGVARLASSVLFGIQPADPAALSAAAVLLGLVSLGACYLPAVRASRVDPVIALAEE